MFYLRSCVCNGSCLFSLFLVFVLVQIVITPVLIKLTATSAKLSTEKCKFPPSFFLILSKEHYHNFPFLIQGLGVSAEFVCEMGQQPDPDTDFKMRWVLPYTKEELCQCTKVIVGGANSIPLSGWNDHFYRDSPLPLVNSHDVGELRALLGCDDRKGRYILGKLIVIHLDAGCYHCKLILPLLL